MALYSCCDVATIQVGVCVLSFVFFLLAAVIFLGTIFNYYVDYNLEWPIPLIVIVCFVILMVIAGYMMFLASYRENMNYAIIAMALVLLITGVWLCLSTFSFMNSKPYCALVCNHLKCPETFWLAEMRYRGAWRNECYRRDKTSKTYTPNKIEPQETTESVKTVVRIKQSVPSTTEFQEDDEDEDDTNEARINAKFTLNTTTPIFKKFAISSTKFNDDVSLGQRNKVNSTFNISSPTFNKLLKRQYANCETDDNTLEFGAPLVGAIIIAIFIFCFLLFTSLVLWSYVQELHWMENFRSNLKQ